MLKLNKILLFEFSLKYATLPFCSSSYPPQSIYFACKHPACYSEWLLWFNRMPQRSPCIFDRRRGNTGSVYICCWSSVQFTNFKTANI